MSIKTSSAKAKKYKRPLNKYRQAKTPLEYYDYIVSQHGIKDCLQITEELGCSWSLVCHVWRNNGLSGRLWSNGNKRSI